MASVLKALYRKDIGYVDIVWGVAGQNGYGLAHIISEHGDELKQLGFEIEDFISMVFAFGKKNKKRIVHAFFLMVKLIGLL